MTARIHVRPSRSLAVVVVAAAALAASALDARANCFTTPPKLPIAQPRLQAQAQRTVAAQATSQAADTSAAGRQIVGSPGIWRVLEHKLFFDELYDALFYRPAAAVSNTLRRNVEEPVVERSLDEIGSGTIQVGGEVGRVQSGLLRTYAVAIAFSVAVLVVVFVAVR